ncbi:MAG: GntR family transcriptional regulator [Thermodesulfobacteriota bacterium]
MKLQKKPIPLYFQLERVLRKRILSGKLKPDQALPTENELCREFGISRTTVRQALLSLEGDDLIRREQGRGTFVSFRRGAPIRFRLYGAVDDLFQVGSQTQLNLTSKKLVNPSSAIVKEMGLAPKERVYLFQGIRFLRKGEKANFQAYVPENIGRDIPLKDEVHPLLIERIEGKILELVKKGRQITTVAVADKKLAQTMEVKEGYPLLVVKRIYYSKSGQVVELAVTHFPGTLHQGVVELVRAGA